MVNTVILVQSKIYVYGNYTMKRAFAFSKTVCSAAPDQDAERIICTKPTLHQKPKSLSNIRQQI